MTISQTLVKLSDNPHFYSIAHGELSDNSLSTKNSSESYFVANIVDKYSCLSFLLREHLIENLINIERGLLFLFLRAVGPLRQRDNP